MDDLTRWLLTLTSPPVTTRLDDYFLVCEIWRPIQVRAHIFVDAVGFQPRRHLKDSIGSADQRRVKKTTELSWVVTFFELLQ